MWNMIYGIAATENAPGRDRVGRENRGSGHGRGWIPSSIWEGG